MRSTTIIREWTDPENSMDPGLTGRRDASAGSRLTGDRCDREPPAVEPDHDRAVGLRPEGRTPGGFRRDDHRVSA
jgi:hypothetical protein